MSNKPDYPSLLNLGFHTYTLADLRKLCVDNFPLSKMRPDIMTNLESLIDELRLEKVEGKVWVDGSFLTEKIDPEDVDILLHVKGEIVDAPTAGQLNVITKVKNNLKHTMLCDSYVLPYYPAGHPWFDTLEWWRAYWLRQFGFSRKDVPKGIAVVSL